MARLTASLSPLATVTSIDARGLDCLALSPIRGDRPPMAAGAVSYL